MIYMGSKRRIAKEINIVMSQFYNEYEFYIEPFVGGANMIKEVTHKRRIGYDINKYLIAYFNSIQNGWLPPIELSREEYLDIKFNRDKYPEDLVGFAGFGASFRGIWFRGYAHDKNFKKDYYGAARRASVKDSSEIQNIEFKCSHFRDIEFPGKSIVYCDAPYAGTENYGFEFNHEEYYSWLRKLKSDGHLIFVSEYSMPDDFKEIWSKEVTDTLIRRNDKNKNKIEKLFILA